MQQCPAELPNCEKIVGVERKRRLMLHPRFAQAATLDSAQEPHRGVRHRSVRVVLQSFEEQLLGARDFL
jgi:hypothetical protein